MKFRRKSARFKKKFLSGGRLALVLSLALWAGWARAETPIAPPIPVSQWRVVITGLVHPQDPFIQPIPGAKDTKFAAAWAATYEEGTPHAVLFMSKEQFAALGVDWEAFCAKSADAASAALQSLQPELIRDRNQVIECAILRSKGPGMDMTAVVLAPDFLKRFTPLFGRKMLLAIPDRNTVYLFPRLASRYQDYAGRVLAVYRKSECPVSREVLELSATGLRAIGEYTEP